MRLRIIISMGDLPPACPGQARTCAREPGPRGHSRQCCASRVLRWVPALAALVRDTTVTIGDSPLHQGAVVEAAVEPVLIARDVLLHRDVDVGLAERDARDVGIL